MKAATTKDECLKAICRFPVVYREENLAPVKIVELSRYWEFRDDIQLEDIENEIRNHEDLVDDWLAFTDDKRWTPAWGISQFTDKFTLFYMFRKGNIEISIDYDEGYQACARLIRFEMEGIKIQS